MFTHPLQPLNECSPITVTLFPLCVDGIVNSPIGSLENPVTLYVSSKSNSYFISPGFLSTISSPSLSASPNILQAESANIEIDAMHTPSRIIRNFFFIILSPFLFIVYILLPPPMKKSTILYMVLQILFM